MHQYVSRVVDLIDPAVNQIHAPTIDEARIRVRTGDAAGVRAIDGSFAIVATEGILVRMARSLDRPLRYFLAKRHEGPALYVADRIDALHAALERDGLADQFHPSYTRMVPAHHLVTIELVGCPDPDPTYTRFFAPRPNTEPADLDAIGHRYMSATAEAIEKWLRKIEATSPGAPIGVEFSGGIDSGAVFLLVYHTLLRLGLSPARLKAFTLNLGDSADAAQARAFLEALDLSLFLEEIEADAGTLDAVDALKTIEDYKPLDVECAAVAIALCRGIRERYPDWRYLIDGDGGDENLKDYPIEENPELTIRSVIDNRMLYQEGWGVGRIKHSLTYSGGLSRGCVRSYGPARRFGFETFSPFARPDVIEVAEGIPYADLTRYDVPSLYALKGEIVSRGIRAVTGFEMPVYPKRRFQHGALPVDRLRARLSGSEKEYRRAFHALYA